MAKTRIRSSSRRITGRSNPKPLPKEATRQPSNFQLILMVAFVAIVAILALLIITGKT